MLSAKDFAKKNSIPLSMIREFCRLGRLPHIQRGRVYWIDEEKALSYLEKIAQDNVKIIQLPKNNAPTKKFNFLERVKELQKGVIKQ